MTDADPEIKAYMDNAARREGIRPDDMHAITLGDTIVIRETHASNVRILREELIHVEQQASGVAIAGRGTITEMELQARLKLLENKDKWALKTAKSPRFSGRSRSSSNEGNTSHARRFHSEGAARWQS